MRKEREFKNTSLPVSISPSPRVHPMPGASNGGSWLRESESTKRFQEEDGSAAAAAAPTQLPLSVYLSQRESCTRQLLPEFLCNQCWLSYIYNSPLPRAGKAQVLQLQREIDKTGAPVRVYLPCCDLGEKQEEEKKQSKEEEKRRNTRGARAQAREERGNGSSKRV